MKSFIIKTLAFTIILLSLLILKYKFTPYYRGDSVFAIKHEHFFQSKAKYNTVFFGSSRVYRHVDVGLFDEVMNDYKLNTFNFAAPATFNPEIYFLYSNFLNEIDSGQIKFAFIEMQELNIISNENVHTTKASYWNNYESLNFALNYLSNSNFQHVNKLGMYKVFLSSFVYKFYDFDIVSSNLKSRNKTLYKKIGLDGFYPLDQELQDNPNDRSIKERWSKFEADTTVIKNRIAEVKTIESKFSDTKLNDYHLFYIKNLIGKSFQKGVHLIFVLPPRLTESQYTSLIPLSKSIPVNHKIELYSYAKHPELYQAKNSFDVGHLNSNGAMIFTQKLSKEFAMVLDRISQ